MLSVLGRNIFRPCYNQSRNLFVFKWLNIVFNRPDFDRIRKVGPDRSCAEWLLKNGAKIKWVQWENVVYDFNQLVLGTHGLLLQEVYAEDSSISYDGFVHFAGCKHITRIVFDKCEFIDDNAMETLKFVSESPLKQLEIYSCHLITDEGIKNIPPFKDLKYLALGNLAGVDRMLICADHLQNKFPNAEIMINGHKWEKKTKEKNEDSAQ